MKLYLVGAELFYADRQTEIHADGQTDMKLIVAFHSFTNEPKVVRI
jgi:hypothetical protein